MTVLARYTWRLNVVVMTVTLLVSACQQQESTVVEAPAERAVLHPDTWPQLSDPSPLDMDVERRIDILILKMTRRQKIGQLMMVNAVNISPEALREYPIGAIYGTQNTNETGAAQREMADRYYASALMANLEDGPFVPPVLYADIRGVAPLLSAEQTPPGQLAREAVSDPEISYQIGVLQAQQLRRFGYAGALLDLPLGGLRSAEHSKQYIAGLQGRVGDASFLDESHIVTAFGPFLGLQAGVVSEVDEALLRGDAAKPSLFALQAGTRGLIATNAKWQGQAIDDSPILLTDIVRGNLGFRGLVLGGPDANLEPGNGLDIILAEEDWQTQFEALNEKVRRGNISTSAIDASVRRVLRVKILSGAFEAGAPGRWPRRPFDQQEEKLLEETVKRSAILLKNERQHLPLSPGDMYILAGNAMSEILAERLTASVRSGGGNVMLAADNFAGVRPDSIIYAVDDTSDKTQILKELQGFKARGLAVTVIVFTRELAGYGEVFDLADAVVAGVQSGSARAAVTELLFVTSEGYVARNFEGRLPMAWREGETEFYTAGHGLRYP